MTYVDGAETGAMPARHILVHGLDRISPGQITVLLVHVVCAGAGIISEPDTEVFNLERFLLVDLRGLVLKKPIPPAS